LAGKSVSKGATENAGLEFRGPRAGMENAGPENAGQNVFDF